MTSNDPACAPSSSMRANIVRELKFSNRVPTQTTAPSFRVARQIRAVHARKPFFYRVLSPPRAMTPTRACVCRELSPRGSNFKRFGFPARVRAHRAPRPAVDHRCRRASSPPMA